MKNSPISSPASYFGRRLKELGTSSESILSEDDLLARSGAVVVLGEPGMGKSELMAELGRRAGREPVTASFFAHSRRPESFVRAGAPLLIDGLDELVARAQGDAVNEVLAQLDAAGRPRFILSCREREWQERAARGLDKLYGAEPLVVSIQDLARDEAKGFWISRGFLADPEPILAALDAQRLEDLYKNPLTLRLLGAVSDKGRAIPPTRAGLFDLVCELTWPEADPERQDLELARLAPLAALDAIGAMMAALIFAGSPAVSLAGAGTIIEGDLAVSELAQLPGAGAAREVFGSKLFRSAGPGRAAPIHRVIAEFLGAKWLARQANAPRLRRRLLAQFHAGGAVPTSLRGLHAWLAHHDAAFAPPVMAADPFGMLRYGETAGLDAPQASALLDSFEDLARRNPYFRAQDWDARASHGLTHPSLEARIREILAARPGNSHMRTLLLQALRGSPLAQRLAGAIEDVVFDRARHFGERDDAVDALFVIRDAKFWRSAISRLVALCDADSARLAINLAYRIDANLEDEDLAAALLASIGLFAREWPRPPKGPLMGSFGFARVAQLLDPARAKSILRAICDVVRPDAIEDVSGRMELSELAAMLLLIALRGGALGIADAPELWHWLAMVECDRAHMRSSGEALKAELATRDDLRRAIQRFAIWTSMAGKPLWNADHYLRKRLATMGLSAPDAAFFLREANAKTPQSHRVRKDWEDLVRIGIDPRGDNAEVIAAASAAPRFTGEHRAILHRALHPKKHAWQLRHDKLEAKRARDIRVQRELDVRHYRAIEADVVAGELNGVCVASKVYLNELARSHGEPPPPDERLAAFFDERCAALFMLGFEATALRADMPTPKDLADAHARSTTLNFCYPLVAGLLARHRDGRGFAGVPGETIRTAFLSCAARAPIHLSDEDFEGFVDALEREAAPDAHAKELLLRAWIEPLLNAGRAMENDLLVLASRPGWLEAAVAAAPDWLLNFPLASPSDEMAIATVLADGGGRGTLSDIARERAQSGRLDVDERRLPWLALSVIHRFEAIRPCLAGFGRSNSEFIWSLRDLVRERRRPRSRGLGVAAAAWTISEFRTAWPFANRPGASSGITNPHDATEFLTSLISVVADDTSEGAAILMNALARAPHDSYTDHILAMADEQLRKRAEEKIEAIGPSLLADLLLDAAPANVEDMKSVIMEEIRQAQAVLLGSDLDEVRDFWDDDGIPHGENRCRDRLAAMLGEPLMAAHEILRIPERDMPHDKRADLAFARGRMQLPVEIKGQWHDDVWNAAMSQLDARYLIDFQSDGRGIYCVFWFGDLRADSHRRLKAPPAGVDYPTSAQHMRDLLTARIPEPKRAFISVVVIDLVTGRKKSGDGSAR